MKHFLTFSLLLLPFLTRSQPSGEAVTNADLPRESISLHLNTTVFLSGETLFFGVYCFNQMGQLSHFSKIAYIELIDSKQQAISKMKVKLENGVGTGDYFFDSTIPSGNYTLIAYTRWMRNFGPKSFYRQSITLINADQLPSSAKSSSPILHASGQVPASSPSLQIVLDKKQYDQREKISLQIVPAGDTESRFTVNVRLLDPYFDFEKRNVAVAVENRSVNPSEVKFLPDVRGELITGMIKSKSTGKPLRNELVSLSSAAVNSGFLLSRTDSTGRFYFNVNDFQAKQMFIKPLNSLAEDFSVSIESSFCEEHSEFAPPEFRVDSAFLKSLTRRYLSAQVENAFYEAKKDSTLMTIPDKLFSYDKTYRLDDFTRFPTMEDVFREIIPEVIVKARQGDFSLSIRNLETGERFYNSPLTLLDGIPVTSTEVMGYNPLLVKRISIVNHRYYLAGLETEGIINIETYKGNAENINTSYMAKVNYESPLPERIYHSPSYESNSSMTRIPDYRTQLFWNGGIEVSKATTLTFFANDIPGEYLVEVVGVNSKGEKISAYQQFTIGK